MHQDQTSCSNTTCNDPHCSNPNCYNYNPEHSQPSPRVNSYKDQEHHSTSVRPNLHYGQYDMEHSIEKTLHELIHDHHDSKQVLEDSAMDVLYHQNRKIENIQKKVDHALIKHVLPILEFAQDELCQHGYDTGIHKEYSLLNTKNAEQNDESSVIAISLSMKDQPVKPDENGHLASPLKNATSSNRIRFFQSGNIVDIHCQFNNSKIQSSIIPISFYHHNDESSEHYPNKVIKALINDFVNLVLMGKRVGLKSSE